MLDQAAELRQRFRLTAAPSRAERPVAIALAGASGGVGATTLAIQLARALIWNGRSTLLVDGDLDDPHLAARLSAEPRYNIPDVLAGRVSLHEALHRGPQGELLLSGAWDRRGGEGISPAAHQRLIEALAQLGGHVDAVVIDAGSRRSAALERWAEASDLLAVVLAPEPAALLDAYALIKGLHESTTSLPRLCATARGETDRAEAALERLAQACWRFLRIELESLGRLPEFDASDAQGSPPAALLATATAVWAMARARAGGNATQSSDPLQPIKSSSRVSST